MYGVWSRGRGGWGGGGWGGGGVKRKRCQGVTQYPQITGLIIHFQSSMLGLSCSSAFAVESFPARLLRQGAVQHKELHSDPITPRHANTIGVAAQPLPPNACVQSSVSKVTEQSELMA